MRRDNFHGGGLIKTEEKGISTTMVAIIIVVVIAVVGIALAVVSYRPAAPPENEPAPPVNVMITMENWTPTSVTLSHYGGDTLNQSDLRLIKNGTTAKDSVGTGTWSAGQALNITGLSGLTAGDTVGLVYKPADQILFSSTLW